MLIFIEVTFSNKSLRLFSFKKYSQTQSNLIICVSQLNVHSLVWAQLDIHYIVYIQELVHLSVHNHVLYEYGLFLIAVWLNHFSCYLYKLGLPTSDCILCNLLCILSFYTFCHFWWMYRFMFDLKYVKGLKLSEICLFRACFAALSTFPKLWIWLQLSEDVLLKQF